MRYQITQKCPESKALRYWSTARIRIPATNLPKLQIDVVPPALRYRLISKFSRDPRRQWRKVCVAASSTLVTARLTCTVRPACLELRLPIMRSPASNHGAGATRACLLRSRPPAQHQTAWCVVASVTFSKHERHGQNGSQGQRKYGSSSGAGQSGSL